MYCNYLRSVQHGKYQNVPQYYVICIFPILLVPKGTSDSEIKISIRLNFLSRFAKLDSVGLLNRLRDEH
jgi:hypothetical protein